MSLPIILVVGPASSAVLASGLLSLMLFAAKYIYWGKYDSSTHLGNTERTQSIGYA